MSTERETIIECVMCQPDLVIVSGRMLNDPSGEDVLMSGSTKLVSDPGEALQNGSWTDEWQAPSLWSPWTQTLIQFDRYMYPEVV
jgi:hypothetical protein